MDVKSRRSSNEASLASRPERFRRAYRIVSRRYATFDGSGTFRWGSRWVSPGRRVVHAAKTYALAVLENLVHWQTRDLPQTLVVIEVRIPEDVAQSRLDPSDVPGWDHPDYAASRVAGDAWYDACETAVLWVPSVVSPHELNVLFNERHPEFRRVVVVPAVPAGVDPRLAAR